MADDTRKLQIRKYPNRRFYDATRSRHVTLPELHELICAGYTVEICDNASGRDITNEVLTQILIERDADKLALFPSETLHQVIRTQAGRLGTVFEGFLRQMIDAQRSSQAQWQRFLQNTLGLAAPPTANPFEWTRHFMQSFGGPAAAPFGSTPANAGPEPAADEDSRPGPSGELEALRRQVEELSRRVEELSEEDPSS